ncbi:glycoside hydrolase family 15 protein [Actinocorallia sp. API 0066]|uniref:glycoside hydrolase family 15 protein n=1 Tax=Actinocorallia sp. API 0066 TaxID=2896846 RepID=UPI001E307A78|nr:glycoside hydrolase family 15 protein [Actinocorallia sp. API 0066]MCD0452734.1 glycoside hydrolase family 15 protein [Actinocorallia sp. API 0066]
MTDYPEIGDHGMVGDLQTAALVSGAGELDWWCVPRFDSPSVFASLLDRELGGFCALSARADSTRQLYLSDTAILLTRFMSPDGVGEVVDFMVPLADSPATDTHRLIRVARTVRGSMRFTLECRPRFDYGRAPHTLEQPARGAAVFHGPAFDLHLDSLGPVELTRDGDDVTSTFTLTAGQKAAVILTSSSSGPPPAPSEPEVRAAFDACRQFWHRWLRPCRYRGRWRDMVNRSAITLKLLTYEPTGAPIAAATMGLPEQIGGERNWDYRYTWVRDASLSVRALIELGFTREADAFRRWMRDRLDAGGTASGEPLQIMYRVDGDTRFTEEALPHLAGYRGSTPVRAGNAAANQIQLDIYGEAAWALAQGPGVAQVHGWQALADVLDWLAVHWDRPDEGIWETRGGRQEFTYSRLMTWVAFDRGIRHAFEHSRPADIEGWWAARDAVYRQIVERGWHAERRAFVQHYATDVLDASLLLMPSVGFVSPRDPAWTSTLDAMDRELVSDGLVYRYNPAASPDGLLGEEGTFNLCSFLYVEALARSGRVQRAQYTFDKILTYANHVGLFAEELGPSGEQLGNFPQAFTHIALIGAAIALDECLDAASPWEASGPETSPFEGSSFAPPPWSP